LVSNGLVVFGGATADVRDSFPNRMSSLTGRDVRTGVHVCRGNWSRDERTLLAGSYAPLAPWFAQLDARQLVLEYATPRAGRPVSTGGKELGLGVVNPRTDAVETVATIRRTIEAALLVVPAAAIFLNPDCGFGSFAARPINAPNVAQAKLAAMSEAAREMRANAR
jgi:5-methyltetrahydropteroyltriglutamate--homocysteine methyltransferase